MVVSVLGCDRRRFARICAGTQTTKALQEIKEITEYKPSIGMVKIKDGRRNESSTIRSMNMIVNEQIKIYLAESEEAAEQAYQIWCRSRRISDCSDWKAGPLKNITKKRALFE